MLTRWESDDLHRAVLIRQFESFLLDAFTQGKLNGTTHTCLGQEYIPVALRVFLEEDDFVFSNHRGHGHYLARFGDVKGLFCEILGREGAICNGVGGSQHIFRPGQYLSTGIQGEGLPVATGVALHFKRHKKLSFVMIHVGDGTWGEGGMYEGLNMAQLWSLPLVVVVENNGISQATIKALQMAGTVEDRAKAFGVRYTKITTFDVPTIRDALRTGFQNTRENPSPWVIEFITLRVGPHSKGDDTRSDEEVRDIKERDWFLQYRNDFKEELVKVERAVKEELDTITAQALEAPLVKWERQ